MMAPKKPDWRRHDFSGTIVRLEELGVLRELIEICRRHHVRFDDVLDHTRSKSIVAARHECYIYLRSLKWSYPEIGRAMLRDHTTIISVIKKAKKDGVNGAGSAT